MDGAEEFRKLGAIDQAVKTLEKTHSLPSTTCLEAERDRGTPFYPALATCKAAAGQ